MRQVHLQKSGPHINVAHGFIYPPRRPSPDSRNGEVTFCIGNLNCDGYPYDEFHPKHSKPIIDEIDRVLAQHYGFTADELGFIINYDIKYRMGLQENDKT